MSKYIKLEDAINVLENTIRVMQGFDEDIKIALKDLPTIEVSEDCISRSEAIKAYNEAVDELVKAEMKEFELGDFSECSFNTTQIQLIARKIEKLPSVAPCVNDEKVRKITQESTQGRPRGRNISASGFLCSECGFGDFNGFHGYEPKFCPNCGCQMTDTKCTE